MKIQPILSFKSTQSRSTRVTAVLIACGLGVAACSSGAEPTTGSDSAATLTPMTLRSDIYYTGAFMPFLAGIQEGIYRKHGIDLKVEPGKGSATTIQTVANGSDDVGFADAGAVVQAAGKGVPILAVGGITEQTPMAVVTLSTSSIKSVQDLNGKTGGFTPGSAPELLFPAFAKKADINVDSIKFNKVDFATRDQLLVSKKIDFSFGFVNGNLVTVAAAAKKACDCSLTYLRYADQGITSLSSSIVVSQAFAKKNADGLKKFLAATDEAFAFAEKNRDQAVADYFKVAPDGPLTADVVRSQWDASVPLLHSTATEGQPFGCMSGDDWASTLQLQQEYAGVDSSLKADALYTNEYLPHPQDCK